LEEIVLIGFSLGCFPTATTAAKHKIKAVVLLSPMASLISLFEPKLTPFTFFKDDEFNILEIVENIESHILIVHSRDDELIPFRHS
jgi:esterase/lipase